MLRGVNVDTNKEIKKIIEGISKKHKYKDINLKKLQYLFENVEFDAPDFSDYSFLMASFKKEAKKNVPEKKSYISLLINQLSSLKPVLVPAMAVIVLLTGYLFYGIISDSGRDFGMVSSVEGNVKLLRGNKTLYLTANEKLYQGDRIIAEPKSYIDMRVSDYVTIRIAENSTVAIDELNIDKNHNIVFSLMNGRCLTSVKKIAKGDRVIVNTPISVGVVRGTLFGAEYNGDTAQYEVFDGKIRVNYKINADIDNVDTRLKLSDYFKDNAVIVGKNQLCKIKSNKSVIDKYIAHKTNTILRKFELPVIYPLSIAQSLMLEDVKKFLFNNFNDNAGSLYPYFISVKPERALIYIDNDLKEQGLLFLEKGKHRVRVVSKGFKQRDLSITVDKSMRNLVVNMTPRNDSYAIWHSGLRSGYIFYEPGLKTLIAVDVDGIVSASDLKHVLWTKSLESTVAVEPVMIDKKLYIASSDGSIISIDLAAGNTLWKTKITDSIVTTMKVIHDRSSVYVAANEGFLYRLNKVNGAVLWGKKLPFRIKSGPVLSGSMVFAGLQDGWLYGLGQETGQNLRKIQLKGGLASLAASGNTLFFTTSTGVLHSYDYSDNKILWKYTNDSSVITDISIKGESLYAFSNEGTVYKFNFNGKRVWEQFLGNSISMWPAEDSNNLYFSGTDNLFVLNKNSGEVVWSFVVRDLLTKTIALSPEKIFLVSGNKGLMVLNK